MGLRDGFPVGVGYFAISFAVGVFASSLGLSWFEALAISVLNFTSAGEIAAIPIIAAGGSLLELALTQLVINSRYALMAISLSQRFGSSIGLRDRFILSFFNGDEIFALVCTKESLIGRKYMYALILFPYLGWVTGTLLGALLGDLLPSMLTDALAISLYSMLITIVTQASKTSRSTLLCVLTAILASCAFAFLPVLKELPSGIVTVGITVVISTVFALLAPIHERDPWEEEVEA
jgi:4-azaleucine resistance transporter AzlC